MKYKFRKKQDADYSQLKNKLFIYFTLMAIAAVMLIMALYQLIWRHRAVYWILAFLQNVLGLRYGDALSLYRKIFREHMDFFFLAGIIALFLLMLRIALHLFTRYFDSINAGINALLAKDQEIHLPPEMISTERSLNAVRETLARRTNEAKSAEQRKDDLVMYLAHDIRTPLTSIIGYLNIIEEAPDLPQAQREKYVHITLDKAYGLENMINEFFEITRYNLQQITLAKETIDLYYMLVQLMDEFFPIFSKNGNTAVLNAEESLTVYGDRENLARVFHNVLKNAAAYSFPGTKIEISAQKTADSIVVRFQNSGRTIPAEKLSSIFEKFYRLDESRATNTGGSGLGLAIAKEIITLHNGTIAAESKDNSVVFIITLPVLSEKICDKENENREK